ncbi:MAG: leucine-rich repeat domain-containing protein [Candidatus Borkfalkia sp.]
MHFTTPRFKERRSWKRLEKYRKACFSKCNAITDLTFGANLKSIDDYAFYSCSGLSNIVLPKSLEYIGKYAFVGCRGLTGIVLPAGIRTVDSFAFAGLSNVTFYAQANERDADWIATWNPSYRPVVWGVTLSDDGSYVVKFTKNGNITNANATTDSRRLCGKDTRFWLVAHGKR